MRDLRRNQQTIWYATYLGKAEKLTPQGIPTGQQEPQYAEPVSAKVSISASRGSAEVEMLGKDVEYDRTITTVQALPIDEYSKVWIDKTPADGDANYTVQRKAPNLNQHVWALKKVVGQ